ncbi:hypothetical protein SeMB42_g04532 [Synchytrium endobioticum]|uniref:Ribosomal protein S2 n=1 Tax=Synchytrium endobioticum TaxID=286115 RepID=A0A507CXN7_9FUNG|nr:hypothetical protein SeMB42_g04532 [Synchytrium endobioticum]
MNPSHTCILRRRLLSILRQRPSFRRTKTTTPSIPSIRTRSTPKPAEIVFEPYPPDVKARLEALVPPSASSYRNYLAQSTIPQATQDDDAMPDSATNTQITMKHLIAAGLHLGHSVSSWHSNMLPYIYGSRHGIHIINLEHTAAQLRRAMVVAREVAAEGGKILFVGTRKAIHKITYDAATLCSAFYVLHWIGGCITNRERVLRRSSGFDPDKVIQLAPVPGMEDADDGADDAGVVVGSASKKPPKVPVPDLIICLDYPNTFWAVHEANLAHVPVIAICDTDCDPTRVQYPIAANDDALTSVEFIAGVLARAASEGVAQRAKRLRKVFAASASSRNMSNRYTDGASSGGRRSDANRS